MLEWAQGMVERPHLPLPECSSFPVAFASVVFPRLTPTLAVLGSDSEHYCDGEVFGRLMGYQTIAYVHDTFLANFGLYQVSVGGVVR